LNVEVNKMLNVIITQKTNTKSSVGQQLRQKRRWDQPPWRSKHPLLTGHTRREPLVEITLRDTLRQSKYENYSLTKGMKQIIQHVAQ
jgi:hypothetical protein